MPEVLYHKHLIFRIETPTPPKDVTFISDWMKDLIKNKLHMNILFGPHVEYLDVEGNRGATGVCILSTSHCAMHVWDEPDPGLIELDVYTCGKMELEDVVQAIQVFNPSKVEYKFLDREHNLQLLSEGFVTL
jgi:S-adenosylmethionine/arginine decarboxylase-like enzyme